MQRAGNDVFVEISDSGPGVPPGHESRIFERFYRADRSRTRATGGSGLGLAIVKHIVEAHGGEVALSNRPGQGATFRVSLPLNEPTRDMLLPVGVDPGPTITG